MSSFRSRVRSLATLALAVGALSSSGCAPEVSLCQVDGALLGTDLYINVVGYVRVYGEEPYEGRATVAILDSGGRTVAGGTTRTYELIESGGSYLCVYTVERSGEASQRRLGIGPFPMATVGNVRSLSVRLTMNDRSGNTQTVTLPLSRVREVDEMPNFNCGSIHCGR